MEDRRRGGWRLPEQREDGQTDDCTKRDRREKKSGRQPQACRRGRGSGQRPSDGHDGEQAETTSRVEPTRQSARKMGQPSTDDLNDPRGRAQRCRRRGWRPRRQRSRLRKPGRQSKAESDGKARRRLRWPKSWWRCGRSHMHHAWTSPGQRRQRETWQLSRLVQQMRRRHRWRRLKARRSKTKSWW